MTTVTSDLETNRLLQAAQGGDQAAFARWVALTQSMVTAIALSITADPQLSEDVAQETYFEAWRRLPQIHTRSCALPWLREVARNKAIDALRRKHTEGSVLTTSDAAAEVVAFNAEPLQEVETQQRIQIALHALKSLDEGAREVILLYYREGERSQNVATMMGVSDATVRKRLQRARSKLRSEAERAIQHLATESAPRPEFSTAIIAAIGCYGKPATASGLSAASVAKAWSTKLISATLASVAIVAAAVAVDTRIHWRRARNANQRRHLLLHGMVYGMLMAGYMLALQLTEGKHKAWPISLALIASALVFVLTYWRARILRH